MERSSRRLLMYGAAVALVALGLWAIADRAPRLPADADHAIMAGEPDCLRCHGHAGRTPRPADHPPRDDCFSCHADAAGTLHPRPDAATSIPGGWQDDPRRAVP